MKTAASAKLESNHKPAGGKPRFSAKMTAFASTGIACPLAWGFLINAFGGVSPSAQLPWTFSYLLLAVAVLLFAAVSRKAPTFFTSGISAAVVGAFGALGALLLALTFTAIPSIPLQFAAMALCACVLGWLYLQWGTFYAKLDLRHAVVYLLLVSSFCLEMRDQDTKWLFAELRGEPVSAPADYRSLEERCEEVGKQHKLTPRELEIMQLLCKGRTKAYIAETLYLTENTVKGHTKHIYSKLDVHSKQELLDLVER